MKNEEIVIKNKKKYWIAVEKQEAGKEGEIQGKRGGGNNEKKKDAIFEDIMIEPFQTGKKGQQGTNSRSSI